MGHRMDHPVLTITFFFNHICLYSYPPRDNAAIPFIYGCQIFTLGDFGMTALVYNMSLL